MTTSLKTKRVTSKKPFRPSRPSSSAKALRKRALLPFEKKILSYARNQNLWHKGDFLLIAVSGGPDSVALFHTLLHIAPRDGLRLAIVHVNYQLRGQASQDDALFVQTLATKHGLPFYSHTHQPEKRDEDSLRKIRYTFFDTLKKKLGANLVVLGHQKNDQAETVLLRLLRGAGPKGLQAMKTRRLDYIRPLLATTREEILIYLKSIRATYQTDQSNFSPQYLRNRIRHNLLPLLAKDYQLNIVDVLAKTASHLSEHHFHTTTKKEVGVLAINNTLCFSLKELLFLAKHTRTTFLRTILEESLKHPISTKQTDELEKMLKSTKSKAAQISFHGLKITKKGDTVTLHQATHS